MTTSLLERRISGAISLNPWRTLTEARKLSTYVAIGWLAFTLARDADIARRLLNVVIVIGAIFAVYAFALGLAGTSQFTLFYSLPPSLPFLSGPFVSHNSFATFEGMASLASLVRLVEAANQKIIVTKGFRRWFLTALQFVFGSGVLIVIATILTVSSVVASASRAGFFSTCIALLCVAFLFGARLGRHTGRRWVLLGAIFLSILLVVLTWVSGGTLNSRITDLVDAGNADEIRLALWSATERMIAGAPLLGLGLGTFQDAYPMYATKIFPFIMDKAHCDYLEFAAGLGLLAATSWWFAIVWSVGKMLSGLFRRRKGRSYLLVGIGSTILVAVHSTVDFSLQMPAVSAIYATLLAIGLAQSYSSREVNSKETVTPKSGN
jgi:O-antigen ligase